MASRYLEKGYQVYVPVVQQSNVDLVVELPTGMMKVQVKTAWWNRCGKYQYLQCRMRSTNNENNAAQHVDIVAVVYGNEMWIIPASEITSSNISLRGTRPGYKATKWDQYKVR